MAHEWLSSSKISAASSNEIKYSNNFKSSLSKNIKHLTKENKKDRDNKHNTNISIEF